MKQLMLLCLAGWYSEVITCEHTISAHSQETNISVTKRAITYRVILDYITIKYLKNFSLLARLIVGPVVVL